MVRHYHECEGIRPTIISRTHYFLYDDTTRMEISKYGLPVMGDCGYQIGLTYQRDPSLAQVASTRFPLRGYMDNTNRA